MGERSSLARMNHGLRTYQWSCRSLEEDDDEITVFTDFHS